MSEDFAYAKIMEYEKFGSKVPGSSAHKKAGDWVVSELKSYGFTVLEQLAEVKLPDGKKAPIRNIIGQQPGTQKKESCFQLTGITDPMLTMTQTKRIIQNQSPA